jgi:ribulose-5-phosphate 4-epimerase/fuculose-1-phosphate aldolase
MHRLMDNAAAVFHTHMPFASALARLDDPQILPIGQTELGTLVHTAYDDCYDGPAFDPAEGERLVTAIGDKSILIMANHGALTVGRTCAEAYDALYYLERVAQVQLYAMWTQRPLKMLPQKVVDQTLAEFRSSRTYGGKKPAVWHFEALKRILDRKEPDYKT